MKIQLLSDLHLETCPEWRAQPAEGADLLVLAGDIGSYQSGSRLQEDDFGLTQFSPQAGWPTPAVFVPGNHEYDAMDFDVAHARLQATCRRLGLLWLERDVLYGPWKDQQGNPIRLLGTTLWTDFDALNDSPNLVGTANSARTAPNTRAKAFRAANFYLRRAQTSRYSQPFLAEQVREQSLVCQAWLRATLEQPFMGSTVVVTHFAPSLLSADPRYGLVPSTAGFCNQLDDCLSGAQLWLHGHLHAPSDYVHQACRVVANPLGYLHKNEQVRFIECATIQI